jgi:uncharacterized protein YjbI with pentapeptide repeats
MNEIKKANFNEDNLEKANLEWADFVDKYPYHTQENAFNRPIIVHFC